MKVSYSDGKFIALTMVTRLLNLTGDSFKDFIAVEARKQPNVVT